MKIIAAMFLLWAGQNLSAATFQSLFEGNPCLEVNDDSSSGWRFGANVEVGTCDSGENQQFQFVDPESIESGYTIQINGKCLDIDQSTNEDWTQNSNIVVMPCNGSPSQQFDKPAQEDGSISIHAHVDGRCLDIDLNNGNGWRYERNVHLWQCHGEPNQLWKLETVPSLK